MFKLEHAETYEAASLLGAEIMAATLFKKPTAVLCIATGRSPRLAYRLFVKRCLEERIDTSQMTCLQLDEWYPLSRESDARCEAWIQRELIIPLGLREEQFLAFDSSSNDPVSECGRMTERLDALRTIDLCILGLGANGHIGLNEPADSLEPEIHLAKLAATSKKHTMLLDEKQEVHTGMTLGMRHILQSSRVLLLVTGEEKQKAYSYLLHKKISTKHPASFLWLHPNAIAIVDKQSVLNPEKTSDGQ